MQDYVGWHNVADNLITHEIEYGICIGAIVSLARTCSSLFRYYRLNVSVFI